MNPMLLSNVIVKKMQGSDKSLYHIPSPLEDVVYALATANPTWQLTCESMGHDNYKMDRFHIHVDGQRVGGLKHDWSNRSNKYAVLVQADSIGSRKDHIVTSDTKKAIREAQKHFVPKSLSKVMDEHIDKAKRVVESQRYRKQEKAGEHMRNLREHITKFAFSIQREAFDAYIDTTGKRIDMVLYEETRKEVKVLETIGSKIKHHGVYITLHKGGYLVKALDNVQQYTDTTLPEEYRGKLGMLKLVEVEQCIEDVGCRVTEDVYVITI